MVEGKSQGYIVIFIRVLVHKWADRVSAIQWTSCLHWHLWWGSIESFEVLFKGDETNSWRTDLSMAANHDGWMLLPGWKAVGLWIAAAGEQHPERWRYLYLVLVVSRGCLIYHCGKQDAGLDRILVGSGITPFGSFLPWNFLITCF